MGCSTAAKSRLPNEPGVFIDYGRVAELRKDWHGMAERFADVRERFPDNWEGYTGRAQGLSMTGKIADAEALLEEGQQRCRTRRRSLSIMLAWRNCGMIGWPWNHVAPRYGNVFPMNHGLMPAEPWRCAIWLVTTKPMRC